MKTIFKIFIAVILSIFLWSCTKEYKYDEKDYNIFGGKSRTNSYEQFGNFPLQIAALENISSNDSSGIIQLPLRLTNPFTIVANTNGKIQRINNSSVDKSFLIDSAYVVATGMTADKNSNIYFITSNDMLYSVDFDLKLRWKKELPVKRSRELTYSDLLAIGDGLIVAANSGKIIKYNFNGEILWTYHSALSPGKTFCSDEKNNIYIPLTNNQFDKTDSLLSISSNGKLNWRIDLPNSRILSSAAYRNSKIYLTGSYQINDERKGKTYSISIDGKIMWQSIHTLPGRQISIDYDGNVYITSISSGVGEIKTGLYGFNQNGKEIWNLYLGAATVSPFIISQKYLGITAFTGDGAAMLFLRKSDGLLVRNHSLSNYPPLYLQPYVSEDNSIKLFGSTKLKSVKFSETILEKILP